MHGRQRTARRLAFESLEPKWSPTTLLLALAPLEEPAQRELEESLHEGAWGQLDRRGCWRYPHAAADLLQFVEQQTGKRGGTELAWQVPSAAACAAADGMMRLQDPSLRALVMVESLDMFSEG